MTIVNPSTGWSEIFEGPMYDLDEVMGGIDEYTNKSSARVRMLLNKTWLIREPNLREFVFDNIYEFKWDFTPLLKCFDIKPVFKKIKNPQTNAPVERVQQVILNTLVTKYLDKKVLDYIYP